MFLKWRTFSAAHTRALIQSGETPFCEGHPLRFSIFSAAWSFGEGQAEGSNPLAPTIHFKKLPQTRTDLSRATRLQDA
jgi:hypothetical protein